MSYVDDFRYLAFACFLCVPIVFLLKKAVAKPGAVSAATASAEKDSREGVRRFIMGREHSLTAPASSAVSR